jgi:hypothetical protein
VDKFDRAWQLFRQSFVVLSQEEGILLFPALSAISAILLGAAFFVPLFELGTFQALARHRATWMDWLPLFSWYYANTFVVVFFNSALVGCANIRLSGGNPTVADGLGLACTRIHRIAAWTLLAATVGLLLRAIEERSERMGRIVASLLGIGWTMVTYLIVPVIILEDRPIGASVSRSADLFKRTWGEQLAGNFGFGLLNLVLAVPGLGLAAVLYSVSRPAGLIVGVVYLLMQAAVTTAVRGIFTVALYRFATTGEAPFGFSADALRGRSERVDDFWTRRASGPLQ